MKPLRQLNKLITLIMGIIVASRIAKNSIVLLLTSLCTFTTHAKQNNINDDSLWQITTGLKSVWGQNIDAVSTLLNQPLIPYTLGAKDRFTSAPFTLRDGITISALDVRLSLNSNAIVTLVSFTVSGQCITLEDVKEHFPDATLHFVPHAKLPGRTFGYLTRRDSNNLA